MPCLSEKHIAYQYCSYYPCQVGQKATWQCVSWILYSNRAEIQCQNIKGCLSRPQHDAGKASCKSISPEDVHRIYHHSPGTTTAQWFHQCGGQCIHREGVNTKLSYHPGNTVNKKVHSPGSTEHPYSYKYCNQIGDNLYCNSKAFLASFDKGFIDIDLLD